MVSQNVNKHTALAMAKIYEKTTNEAFEILNARFLEGLGELKGVVIGKKVIQEFFQD